MARIVAVFAVLLVVLGALAWKIFSMNGPATVVVDGQPATAETPLIVYCAASNRPVFEAVRADYEKEFGIPIQAQYGASQTLLTSFEVSQAGDLYLPADDSYLNVARERNLISEIVPLATMKGTVGVARGNPQGIASFDDLLREDVRLVQANPDAAAVGKLTRDALSASGQWAKLEARTRSFKQTVNDVANDVKVGAADAGIVYDVVVKAYPDLESVNVPEISKISAQISVAVVAATKNKERALHLAKYLADPDKGQKRYREFGFQSAGATATDEASSVEK